MRRGWLAVAAVAALLCTAAADASPGLRAGITDSGGAYYADPASFYPALGQLGAQVLRVHLNWGGKLGVARRRPVEGTDVDDPAYDWRLYDRIVLGAERQGVEVLFTIFGTPPWANGGAPADARAARRDPAARVRLRGGDPLQRRLRARATASLPPARPLLDGVERAESPDRARARSGAHRRALGDPERPRLRPDLQRRRGRDRHRDGAGLEGRLRRHRRAREQQPARRPAVRLAARVPARAEGGRARGFDAYAHHPYYGAPSESPVVPLARRGGVTLGNIDDLVRELTRLYGRKPLWLTEYGYQTNPPDGIFGVPWSTQARYLRQSFAIARAHPRIDMLLWFLLRDEGDPARWQSGLISARGERKPAFAAFRAELAELRR